MDVTYRPLFQEEQTKTFSATCKEMGTFSYSLVLSAQAAVPEPAIMFRSTLGHSLTQNVEVVDTKSCQYKVRTDEFGILQQIYFSV